LLVLSGLEEINSDKLFEILSIFAIYSKGFLKSFLAVSGVSTHLEDLGDDDVAVPPLLLHSPCE
jgi:hypothetical protein